MRHRRGKRSTNINARWTGTRQAILDTFRRSRAHISAENVYERVKKIHSTISLATVYRNLEYLRCERLINCYQFGEGKARYELNKEGSEHNHLICTKCGKICDYAELEEREMEFMHDLEELLSKKYNYDISYYQLHFYGLCEKCKKM